MTCRSVRVINMQTREVNFGDFKNISFKIGLQLGTYEPISFKFEMMIDMTSLYILMTLTFSHGQRYEKVKACAIALL